MYALGARSALAFCGADSGPQSESAPLALLLIVAGGAIVERSRPPNEPLECGANQMRQICCPALEFAR